MSYNTKIYREQGGSRLVIGADAELVIAGKTYTGSQLADLLDLLADLPAENVEAPGIWNDVGVLKVGTAQA
jgi:hypothetical protein